MPDFEKKENLGMTYYFHPQFQATTIPLQGFEGFPVAAAPLIHAYAVNPLNCSRLVLNQEFPPILINGQEYRVKVFLSVQKINRDFLEELDGRQFSPTVKPHYVFKVKANGVFSEKCPTAIYVGDENICQGKEKNQQVIAHDGTLSPPLLVNRLKGAIEAAVHVNQDLFASSYVVSRKQKEVLITSHCLLSDASHDALFEILDASEGLTLDDISNRESPIQKQLQDFQTGEAVQSERIESLVSKKVTQSQIAEIIAYYHTKSWYGILLSIFGIKHMSKTMIALDHYVKTKNSSELILLKDLVDAINTPENDDGRKQHRINLFNDSEVPDDSGTDAVIEQIKNLYKVR
jgi:hypothetical protein